MVLNSARVMKYLTNAQNAKAQQHGVDLTLNNICVCNGGHLIKSGATQRPQQSVRVTLTDDNKEVYVLDPGMYAVYFEQGVKLPNYVKANIIHRSSLLRIGGILMSAEYDPGFEVQNMGAFLNVTCQLTIERGARIAQIVMYETEPCEKYEGQYQNEVAPK
jgi:deoxycytidine triphosphate deaminase